MKWDQCEQEIDELSKNLKERKKKRDRPAQIHQQKEE